MDREEFLRQIIEDVYVEAVLSKNPEKSLDDIINRTWGTMETLDLQERAQCRVKAARGGKKKR